MKHSIEWHQECLQNKRASLKRLGCDLEILLTQIEKINKECDLYTIQIREAIKKKKDGFDREKFLKNLKKDVKLAEGEDKNP